MGCSFYDPLKNKFGWYKYLPVTLGLDGWGRLKGTHILRERNKEHNIAISFLITKLVICRSIQSTYLCIN